LNKLGTVLDEIEKAGELVITVDLLANKLGISEDVRFVEQEDNTQYKLIFVKV